MLHRAVELPGIESTASPAHPALAGEQENIAEFLFLSYSQPLLATCRRAPCHETHIGSKVHLRQRK